MKRGLISCIIFILIIQKDTNAQLSPFQLFTPVVYIDSYGARGDGITDDAPIIQTAVSAVPSGGKLIFSAGKTYLIKSQNIVSGDTCAAQRQTSINIDLNGATIKADSSLSTGAIFCFHNQGGFTYENGTVVLYNANTINRGDTTVTLTTPAQASNFIPGDVVYMQGEIVDFNNRGVNIVTNANAGTGVLTMRYPIGKTYVTTPKIGDAQSQTDFNYSIENGTIQSAKIVAVVGAQIFGFRVSHIKLSTTTATAEPFLLNYLFGATFEDNYIETNFGPTVELAGRSCTNCRVVGNFLALIPTNTGTGPTGSVITVGEGAERATIFSNSIQHAGNSVTGYNGVDLSASFDTTFVGNSMSMGTSTGSAVTTNNGTGSATSPVVSNNVINSIATGLTLGAADQDSATGNIINMFGSIAGAGIHAIGPAVIIGGAISGMLNGTAGIIIESAAAMPTQVNGVKITAKVAGSGAWGIRVVDPGAQQAIDPTLIGNIITNYTTPISFQNAANNAHRVICANQGVTSVAC